MKAYKALKTIEFKDGTRHVAGQIYSSSELTQPYFDVNRADYEEVGGLTCFKDVAPGTFLKIAGEELSGGLKFLYVGKDGQDNYVCMYCRGVSNPSHLAFFEHKLHSAYANTLVNTFVAQNWED